MTRPLEHSGLRTLNNRRLDLGQALNPKPLKVDLETSGGQDRWVSARPHM